MIDSSNKGIRIPSIMECVDCPIVVASMPSYIISFVIYADPDQLA